MGALVQMAAEFPSCTTHTARTVQDSEACIFKTSEQSRWQVSNSRSHVMQLTPQLEHNCRAHTQISAYNYAIILKLYLLIKAMSLHHPHKKTTYLPINNQLNKRI